MITITILILIFITILFFCIFRKSSKKSRVRRRRKRTKEEEEVLKNEHKEKVIKLQRRVKHLFDTKKEGEEVFYSRNKSSCSHSPPKRSMFDRTSKHQKIETGQFDEILEVDAENLTCIAESGVTFEQISQELLTNYGLLPKCVPELKTITLGGAIAGGSVESFSFKYGGFFHSCIEIEFIDGKGEVHTSSRDDDDNDDQFQMLHGTFGTLGIITKIKFELITATNTVELEYRCFPTIEKYLEEIAHHHTHHDIDMMDGIIHSNTEFILIIANFIPEEEKKKKKKTAKNFILEPFYKRTRNRKNDIFPTLLYLFRYDSDCHWSVKNLPFFETKIFRLLTHKFFQGSSNLITLGKKFPFLIPNPPDVIVDVFIPFNRSIEFYNWCKELFDYYPLWIVPYLGDRSTHKFQSIFPETDKEILFIDFAIYGFQQKNNGKKNKNYYKLLEEKVAELKGYKTLISHNYYSKDQFWEVFDFKFLQQMKKEYDPKNLFRDLYSKTISKK